MSRNNGCGDDNVYDVVVVGGGTTGIISALAAGMTGAKTCLVEPSGYVGGTTYALGNVITFHNNRMEKVVGGVPQKLVDRLVSSGGAVGDGHLRNPGGQCGTVTLLDPPKLNIAALDMMCELGVDVMLQTTATRTLTENGAACGLELWTRAGQRKILARTIVDSSGDADVALQAGAEIETDRTGERLTGTSVFRIAGVNPDALIGDLRKHPERIILFEDPYFKQVKTGAPENVLADVTSIYDLPFIYIAHIVRDYIPQTDWARFGITGLDKSQWGMLKPFGSRVHISPSAASPNAVFLNTTNVHFDPTDPIEISRAEIEGQRQVALMAQLLKEYVPGFEDSFLVGANPRISVRASRRIVGEYRLTKDEVTYGARSPESIAKGAYPMSVTSETHPNVRHHLFVKDGGDYDIPYGCLVPKGVDGLLVAGRCMSGDREASGSSRNGAQCMAGGHAAGTAAALSAKQKIPPRALNVKQLQETLISQGAIL